ncbi:MAG: hypothetical protein J3T61_00065 [Candidatus Brocadiales bacterium]|nr:hypothetical protein [Candidatus Bathyanammoxibius sp.]
MTTTTGTFSLYLSTDPIDEPTRFEVEVTAEITEAIPERGPSYACGGEPAVEGCAEIIKVEFNDRHRNHLRNASWVLDFIPLATQEAWEAKLLEDYSPADDRADWERDQRLSQATSQAVLRKRFDMLNGETHEPCAPVSQDQDPELSRKLLEAAMSRTMYKGAFE